MPELYTFITERIDSLETLNEVKYILNEWNIEFEEHKIEDRYYFLSGYNWEEDCGYPVDLSIAFDNSGVNCVYCNNNEYGVIKGNSMRLINSTSKEAEHI